MEQQEDGAGDSGGAPRGGVAVDDGADITAELTYKELINNATSASLLCQLNHGTTPGNY